MNQDQINEALRHVTLIGFAGRPGCGKEYTGNALLSMQKCYGRIIMSQLIAAEITGGTDLGKRMSKRFDAGLFVSDDDCASLLLNQVARLYQEGVKIIILDGFPRNPAQQEMIHSWKARFCMFFIELHVEKAIARMLERKRSGENREKCLVRQGLFEEMTLPMINGYRRNHPETFRQIDGSLQDVVRARHVHQHVIQLGLTVQQPLATA